LNPQVIELIGGVLIDGTGRDPQRGLSVTVRDGAIIAVKPPSARHSADTQVIDITGMTVMPGMIDMHVHLFWGAVDSVNPEAHKSFPSQTLNAFERARRTLRMGFTTLRDTGDYGWVVVALRDAINSGVVEGPRIFSAGNMITCTGSAHDGLPLWLQRTDDILNTADGVAEIRQAVRRQVKMQTDWIKIVATGGATRFNNPQNFSDEEIQTLVAEARMKGKPVVAHAIFVPGALAAAKAGVQSIEHCQYMTEEIADLMVEKGIAYTPTLSVGEAIMAHGVERGFLLEVMARVTPVFLAARNAVRLAISKGVRVGVGTDVGFGPSPHGSNATELEWLTRAGMTPMQAIEAATRVNAETLGQGDKLGTIQAGKTADIVVVRGDPLADIALLQAQENIALVLKGGQVAANRLPS
jgi:imidazolonepropionase-like amidohydrolase